MTIRSDSVLEARMRANRPGMLARPLIGVAPDTRIYRRGGPRAS
jgi:hypothetical protein